MPIFRIANIHKISRSGIRTHDTVQTSPTLQDNSCSRNLKNYTSDVTFNYFYTGAPIVGIARWSVPRIGQGHLEVKW